MLRITEIIIVDNPNSTYYTDLPSGGRQRTGTRPLLVAEHPSLQRNTGTSGLHFTDFPPRCMASSSSVVCSRLHSASE